MFTQNHSQLNIKLSYTRTVIRAFVFAVIVFVGGLLVVAPSAHANSAVLSVTSISAVQSTAIANNNYANGWKWVFNVTVPSNETVLNMKFANWSNGSSIIPANNNIRFYSAQSSNVSDEAHAITLTAADTYSDAMYLLPNNDLDLTQAGRQVQVTVEVRIPGSSTYGSYSSNYGIQTNLDMVPPVIVGTSGVITSYATSSNGVIVSYTNPTATDLVDGTDVVTCIPSSGSIFPVGITRVLCSATDFGNNIATSSFDVNVIATTASFTNSTLSNLVVSTGTLSPIFSSSTFAYTDSVSNATDTITITPTAGDASSTITVNGFAITSGSSSSPISLTVGTTTITTLVTAGDGVTQSTYTILVNRAATSTGGGTGTTTGSTNSTLSNLVVSTGTLSPIFSSSTFAYTDSVSNATDTITITPTAGDASSTITVNGFAITSGSSSSPISLTVGTTTITTLVTAGDGVTQSTYTILVNRAATSTGGGTGTTTYSITTSANPTIGGTAVGGGVFDAGASVSVTATPSSGYNFVNWTGGPQVSASTTYTFTADTNRTLVANFILASSTSTSTYSMVALPTAVSPGDTITLTWSAPSSRSTHRLDWISIFKVGDANTSYGTWRYTSGTTTGTFTVTAPRTLGTYEFRYLTDNGYTAVATSNPVVVSTGGGTGTTTYSITTSANPTIGGTAVGGGVFDAGASVSVTATPSSGYNFVNWTGGPQVSASTTYTFTADTNRTLVANFILASSTSTSTYSMVALPTAVSPGDTITLTWSAPSSRSTHRLDWISIFKVGDANTSYGTWRYTSGTTTGTFTVTAPRTLGTYEFRYLTDNGYTAVATSNPVVVSTGVIGTCGDGDADDVGLCDGIGTTTATTTLSGGSCYPTDTSWHIISTTTPNSVVFWAIGINNVGSLPSDSNESTWLGSFNYSWSGTDGISGIAPFVIKGYSNATGTETASVAVSLRTSPDSMTIVNCAPLMIVSADISGGTGTSTATTTGGTGDIGSGTGTTTATTTYSMVATSASTTPGSLMSLTWSAPTTRSSHTTDWIGLFKTTDSNTMYRTWTYTNGKTAGIFTTLAPAQAGTYEFRYLTDNGYVSTANSNPITISISSPGHTCTDNGTSTATTTIDTTILSGPGTDHTTVGTTTGTTTNTVSTSTGTTTDSISTTTIDTSAGVASSNSSTSTDIVTASTTSNISTSTQATEEPVISTLNIISSDLTPTSSPTITSVADPVPSPAPAPDPVSVPVSDPAPASAPVTSSMDSNTTTSSGTTN